MGSYEIYGLYHPKTMELRYIGKANDSKKRLKSHLRDSKNRNTPVYTWIKELAVHGIIPECRVLCKTDNWQKSEVELISQYKAMGANLLNVAMGGNEPFCDLLTRASNGAKNAKAIHGNPERKRLWRLKKSLAHALMYLSKAGRHEKVDEIRTRLRLHGIEIG